MESLIDKIKKEIRTGKVMNTIYIDAANGTYPPAAIFETLINPNMDEGVGNTLILYAGQEQERQLREYCRVNNLDARLMCLWSDAITITSKHEDTITDIEFNREIFNNVNLIIIWTINELDDIVFDKLINATYNTPIIMIGDSNAFCDSSYIANKLDTVVMYLSETTRTPDYNLEVIYWNKRVRTGGISQLEETAHRAYDILIKRDEDIPPLEFMNYDITITCRSDYRQHNRDIRDTLGFDITPRMNEPIMTGRVPVTTTDLNGNKIYLAPYTIMKVHEVINDNGLLFVIFNYNERFVKLLVDTEYLHETTKLTSEDYQMYTGKSAVRLEYAYVIFLRHSINKSFDNVLILYSDLAHISSKKVLYQLTCVARKKFKLLTDYFYKIY